MTEMVNVARRIVAATNPPVVAGADTGYGAPFNVIRTVRQYEGAGVAGVHIEDQTLAKKCGHMASGRDILEILCWKDAIYQPSGTTTRPTDGEAG